MSGPKKADVQAELGRAGAAAQRSAAAISRSESSALRKLIAKCDKQVAMAAAASDTLAEQAVSLATTRSDVASVGAAVRACTASRAAVDAATTAAKTARAGADAAAADDAEAGRMFADAQQRYDRVVADLRGAGIHYLQREMAEAQQVGQAFRAAADLAARAAVGRTAASRDAQAALKALHAARSKADATLRSAAAAVAEARQRDAADERARQIAETRRRAATLALDGARAGVSALDAAECAKFHPGAREALEAQLSAASTSLDSGDASSAIAEAGRVADAVSTLAAGVARAREDHDRKLAQALGAVDALDSTLSGADAEQVAAWAGTPTAVADGWAVLSQARSQVEREDFAAAADAAAAAQALVVTAVHEAADNARAHECRESIGDAVMDVLEESGLTVSFEPGTRTEGLRISGQTADPTGRGDVVIDIPLSGEVDFEVIENAGDGNCGAVVRALQERLAERGLVWRTTDWGHGHEPTSGGPVRRTVERTREQERSRER